MRSKNTGSLGGLISCLLLLGPLALGQGCYLSHEPGPAGTPARRDAGTRFDARAVLDSAVLDSAVLDSAVPPDGASVTVPSEDDDIPTWCDALCDAWSTSACPIEVEGCLRGCVARAEQAERVGCIAEWKAVGRCILEMPCRTDCGERSGWPECIGAPG